MQHQLSRAVVHEPAEAGAHVNAPHTLIGILLVTALAVAGIYLSGASL